MTDQIVGPMAGSTVSFTRPGGNAPENAVVASRDENGGSPTLVLNFADGTSMQVAASDVQG